MNAEDEALVNEVTRLEGELLARQKARREAAETLKVDVEEARARVRELEGDVAALEPQLVEARRERDEAVDAARRAQSHLDDLKGMGATKDTPLEHWRK